MRKTLEHTGKNKIYLVNACSGSQFTGFFAQYMATIEYVVDSENEVVSEYWLSWKRNRDPRLHDLWQRGLNSEFLGELSEPKNWPTEIADREVLIAGILEKLFIADQQEKNVTSHKFSVLVKISSVIEKDGHLEVPVQENTYSGPYLEARAAQRQHDKNELIGYLFAAPFALMLGAFVLLVVAVLLMLVLEGSSRSAGCVRPSGPQEDLSAATKYYECINRR